MRKFYCDSEILSNVFNEVINNFDLSKKEIRNILSNKNEDNTDFIEKIKRSLKLNKNDDPSDLARKLNKHCKKVSTENPNKQKEVQKDYIYNLLKLYKLSNICAKLPRIVVFLDNVKSHKTDLVFAIAVTFWILDASVLVPTLVKVIATISIIAIILLNDKNISFTP